MIEVKRFSGVLNTDDLPENVLAPQHIDAKNVRFYGGANGLSAENIKGNYEISNNDLPAGNNQCVGVFFDSVKQRLIWFNWNDNGDSGIYSLDIQSETITPIFICGIDSATDILNLQPNYPVHSASIVYRTTGDGDLLYWTDGYNRPKYINLDTVVTLAPFTEDMLNAAKNAPLNELTLSFSTDSAITVNNVYRKFFRFAYRFVYKNLEKSTFSPTTSILLPSAGFTDPAFNNVINISGTAALTGGNLGDIVAVEIIGQESLGNTFGDYFLITKIPSSEFTGVGGTDFSYKFLNDSTYVTVPLSETLIPFSSFPDKANTLELLNGNVLVYGGITDGYNPIAEPDLDVLVYSGRSYGKESPALSSIKVSSYKVNLIVGGNWTVIPMSGTGDCIVNLTVSWFNVTPQTTTLNLTITNTNTTLHDVAAELTSLLSAALTDLTVTQVGSQTGNNSNTIEITSVNPITISSVIVDYVGYQNGLPAPALIANQKAIPWSSQYRWGLIYFDERGKTNGVISYVKLNDVVNNFNYISADFFDGASIVTPGTSTGVQVPMMMASINHTPPVWAKKMQWVRTPNQTIGNFIQLVTNDFQEDSEFLYFGIDNIDFTKTKNTAFLPSYDFTPGDRVRVIAKYFSGGLRSAYTVQLDLEILGTIERLMTSPNTIVNGTFLKVKKPAGYPFVWGGYSGMYQFIQIYTPSLRTNTSEQLFYEFGEAFDIIESGGNRYHAGNLSNQAADQPATYLFYDGANYYQTRQYYLTVGATTLTTLQVMSSSYNDYYESGVNSDSRGWPIDENAKEEYNGVLVRWGGKYQSGTNINQLNIFQAADFDEVDRAKGDIRRFKTRDRILRVFQDRGVGQYGVYARFIQNNQGQSELVTTSTIITTNNIQYYAGVYGLCGYPTNLASSTSADYFADVVTGRCIRLGRDGLTDLGLLYKGQYYLTQLVQPYNDTIIKPPFTSKVMGFFDFFENQYHVVLEGDGGSLLPQHFSFNETRNGFCSFYDYHPEWAIGVNDMVYSFKEGLLYKHDNTTDYCNFYGTQYNAYLTIVFNNNLHYKKSWNSVMEIASDIWEVPFMQTNTYSYGTTKQISSLNPSEFRLLEGNPSAAIKRDANSTGGKLNGNFMKGQWMVMKFQKTNANNLVNLSEVSVRVSDSPLTVK